MPVQRIACQTFLIKSCCYRIVGGFLCVVLVFFMVSEFWWVYGLCVLVVVLVGCIGRLFW